MTEEACIAGPYGSKLIDFGQLDPGPANLVRRLLLDMPSLRYTARDIVNHSLLGEAGPAARFLSSKRLLTCT